MTRQAAIHQFFESFGIPAYLATNVPAEAQLPYLTYTYGFDRFAKTYASTVQLYYRSFSENEISAKAEQIMYSVDKCVAAVPYDGGVIWVRPGSPFCQSMSDPDPAIRRRYINLEIEYL